MVRVEDLFYNVPARLKFLKQDVTERRAIDALVTRYALAYPDVRFKLTEGKTVTLQTAGDGDRRAILAALYGVDVARQMLEVLAEEDGLQVDRLHQSHRADPFQPQGNHLLRQRALGAGYAADHRPAAGLSHPADGRTLSAGGIVPGNRARRCGCECPSGQSRGALPEPGQVFSFVQRAARRALLAYAPVPQVAPQICGDGQTIDHRRRTETAD